MRRAGSNPTPSPRRPRPAFHCSGGPIRTTATRTAAAVARLTSHRCRDQDDRPARDGAGGLRPVPVAVPPTASEAVSRFQPRSTACRCSGSDAAHAIQRGPPEVRISSWRSRSRRGWRQQPPEPIGRQGDQPSREHAVPMPTEDLVQREGPCDPTLHGLELGHERARGLCRPGAAPASRAGPSCRRGTPARSGSSQGSLHAGRELLLGRVEQLVRSCGLQLQPPTDVSIVFTGQARARTSAAPSTPSRSRQRSSACFRSSSIS